MIITVEVTPSDADESSEVKVREIKRALERSRKRDRTRYAEKVRKRKKGKKERRKKERKKKVAKKVREVYVIHEPINQRSFNRFPV